MKLRIPTSPWLVLFAVAARAGVAAAPVAVAPGPFFEPSQPFFQSQVELEPRPKGEHFGGNFVVRGILLPLPSGDVVLFDQELLRLGAVWKMPAGQPPVTLVGMAPVSYGKPGEKAEGDHPRPSGPVWLLSGMHPGVAPDTASLFSDPRFPALPGDAGRGPLPAGFGHFDGVELVGSTAVLHYRSREVPIREWLESGATPVGTAVLRNFEVGPHAKPLSFALGRATHSTWSIRGGRTATAASTPVHRVGGGLLVIVNSSMLALDVAQNELIATLAPSGETERVTIALVFDPSDSPDTAITLAATPPVPSGKSVRRWPQSVSTHANLAGFQQDGLILDTIPTGADNPWKRRMRVADLAFLTDDRAAVVTFDGDVWLVDGLADPALAHVSWRRFASGLQEPLAIAAPHGVIQVATKNGVVRIYDRSGHGEADWFENFNDQMIQSQTTRSFPLDMALAPDGSTYVTQGGIVDRSGLFAGGEGTRDTGAILKISPDGRFAEDFATKAREPFVCVNPLSGVVTATDQQGHYIPSSACYIVRKGDEFGFPDAQPVRLTPPLVWLPHERDNSSSSEVWTLGRGMGPWNGRLLHLSYGTGHLFVITPDLAAPVAQGAAIPLQLKTDLPLLHGRMNPQGDALFVAGFQIYGSRVAINSGLGRLRAGSTPITDALAARSTPDGVILDFAAGLDPASLRVDNVRVRAWNYLRSSAYGSGRYALDGSAGTTTLGIAQVVLSADRKSVFVQIPHLSAAMQVELSHNFILADGTAARGVAYLTIHAPHALDLAQAGFPGVDLTKAAVVPPKGHEEPATAAQGKMLADAYGCAACHSPDGTIEGKVGPTWKGLYGARRKFIDGTSEIADEVYLREKILNPQEKPMKAGQIEMPSFRGVLGELQIESLILYIKSLTPFHQPTEGLPDAR